MKKNDLIKLLQTQPEDEDVIIVLHTDEENRRYLVADEFAVGNVVDVNGKWYRSLYLYNGLGELAESITDDVLKEGSVKCISFWFPND